MGLIFSVGNPSEVFGEPFDAAVAGALRSQFGDAIELDSPLAAHYSEELPWSGWQELQQRGAAVCGSDSLPHFLSMPAWYGVYLPVETTIGSLEFPDESTPLVVASLFHLITELETIGRALDLPTDDAGLESLAARQLQEGNPTGDDIDVQTYVQLLLCAHVAKERKQPLWIIK